VAAVMRLGVDEVGVTELMGVTEHTRAMATTAAGLLLEALDTDRALVVPLDGDTAKPEVRGILDEIAAWSASALGPASVPTLWRILAHNAHYLDSTWRKEQAVMADGVLSARDKRRVGLGVAMAIRGRYMIEYNAAILRHAGDGDRDILEILGVVDHYTTLNTLSEGMQIDSDIRPPST
jgi:alkylhydroperoxidase/carboxymuconolactone decarboxylase family protein YurZ